MSFFETLIIDPKSEFLSEASHKKIVTVCIKGMVFNPVGVIVHRYYLVIVQQYKYKSKGWCYSPVFLRGASPTTLFFSSLSPQFLLRSSKVFRIMTWKLQ